MEKVVLKLYVSGNAPRYTRAIESAHRIREKLSGYDVQLEVIDIGEYPERAIEDDVLATPTLIKKLPPPTKNFMGKYMTHCEEKSIKDLTPTFFMFFQKTP